MTDDQIHHMVDRFLSWRLPDDFHPDAGIRFDPVYNVHVTPPGRHEPVGTNLFSATQAEAMVRHMVEGMPTPAAALAEFVGEPLEFSRDEGLAAAFAQVYSSAYAVNLNRNMGGDTSVRMAQEATIAFAKMIRQALELGA